MLQRKRRNRAHHFAKNLQIYILLGDLWRCSALIDKLAELAKQKGIPVVRRYSRHEVLVTFKGMGARNKNDVAAAVAKLVPELEPRLPKRRRIWESEHYAMAIFVAAGLALTHFSRCNLLDLKP